MISILAFALSCISLPALASESDGDVADPFTATVKVTVENTIVGAPAELAGNGFAFALTPLDGAPAQDTATVMIRGEGKEEITLRFTEPGTYLYSCRQIPGNSGYWQYDETEYTVIAAVFTDDEGRLTVATALKSSAGGKTKLCSFRNKYVTLPPDTEPAPPDTEPTPPGTEPTPPETDPSSPITGDNRLLSLLLILLGILIASAVTARFVLKDMKDDDE